MERGSDKHGSRVDDELKHDVSGLLTSGHDTHAEEWKSPEPSGEDQPDVDLAPDTTLHGGVPDGMDGDDVEARSELAAYLPHSVFPGVREQLLEHVMDAAAPDALVDQVRDLPAGREFTNVGDVWRALHGGGHVEEHRF